MGDAPDYHARARELLDLQLRGGQHILDEYVAAHSNLPGPAGNFRMVAAVVAAITARGSADGERIWSLLGEWASLPFNEVPSNDPRELLPHTAAVAHGAIGAARPEYWGRALARLRLQARDLRWRTREGVANGLQQMARVSYDAVYHELDAWVVDGDLLEMRAAAAALAEPDLVVPQARGDAALVLHARILDKLLRVPLAARRGEEFQALRKGLGYTISVVTTGTPEHGFARMREWAVSPDKDVRWVIKQNLSKGRLTRVFGRDVADVLALMGQERVRNPR